MCDVCRPVSIDRKSLAQTERFRPTMENRATEITVDQGDPAHLVVLLVLEGAENRVATGPLD